MWAYKIQYYSCDGNHCNAQGLVGGNTVADCYEHIRVFYGDDVEELVIHALDSEDCLLDFEECMCGLTYENFVKKTS